MLGVLAVAAVGTLLGLALGLVVVLSRSVLRALAAAPLAVALASWVSAVVVSLLGAERGRWLLEWTPYVTAVAVGVALAGLGVRSLWRLAAWPVVLLLAAACTAGQTAFGLPRLLPAPPLRAAQRAARPRRGQPRRLHRGAPTRAPAVGRVRGRPRRRAPRVRRPLASARAGTARAGHIGEARRRPVRQPPLLRTPPRPCAPTPGRGDRRGPSRHVPWSHAQGIPCGQLQVRHRRLALRRARRDARRRLLALRVTARTRRHGAGPRRRPRHG